MLSDKTDENGNKMTLEVMDEDLYAPRVTGIHNVRLTKWAGKDVPKKSQQWIYNKENASLVSIEKPGSALFEGFNHNMIVYQWRGLHNQRWQYNIGT